jgi:hypothetical protein
MGLYGLLADGVEGTQVLVVASDERQARIIFNTARRTGLGRGATRSTGPMGYQGEAPGPPTY